MGKYTIKLEEMEVEIEDDLSLEEIEKILVKSAKEQTRKAFEKLIETIDQKIFEDKEEELKSEGFRNRYINTIFGTVYFKRRLYSKKDKYKFYLLDKELKIDKGQRDSKQITGIGLKMASNLSYRNTSEAIEELTDVYILTFS